MPRSEALIKRGADYEQKKQFEKAVQSYTQAIALKKSESSVSKPSVPDIQLLNRVGDLCTRLRRYDQAIGYYQDAIELYTATGKFSNAIALCNKVLRQDPEQDRMYLLLGKLSAKNGFFTDARENFLEYAARLRRKGQTELAVKALKELVDLCPGEAGLRLIVAEQLIAINCPDDALTQLKSLYQTLRLEGREMEAVATLNRIHSLEPEFTPDDSVSEAVDLSEGIVFLNFEE